VPVTVPSAAGPEIVIDGALRSGQLASVPFRAAATAWRIASKDDFGVPSA